METKVEVKTIPLHGLFIHRKQVWRSLGKLRAESHSTTAQKVFMNEHDTEVSTENADFIDGKAGAKWAINEFLKNLWHPASEAPKRRCNYLLLHYKDKEEECFEADVVDTKAWDCYIKGSLVEYINIDDLFPKGGEQ